jgi:hypothetical protein
MKLGEKLQVRDTLPQAALIYWNQGKNNDDDDRENHPQDHSPMIVVDGNHRATMFLSTPTSEEEQQKQKQPKTLKVVVFEVSQEEYSYYEELLHSNYLSCIYGHIKLEDLRKQHLKKCQDMFSK